MSAERTDFVDVLPINSLKTLLSLVKGNHVSAKDAGLAVDNVASYAMGQFLPSDPVMFDGHEGAMGQTTDVAPVSKAQVQSALEAAIATQHAPKGAQAAPMGKIDWKNILMTVLPFILKFLA